jgi:hypothetical protein
LPPVLLLLLLQSVVSLRGKDQSSLLNHKSTVSARCRNLQRSLGNGHSFQ